MLMVGRVCVCRCLWWSEFLYVDAYGGQSLCVDAYGGQSLCVDAYGGQSLCV